MRRGMKLKMKREIRKGCADEKGNEIEDETGGEGVGGGQ